MGYGWRGKVWWCQGLSHEEGLPSSLEDLVGNPFGRSPRAPRADPSIGSLEVYPRGILEGITQGLPQEALG